MTGGAEARPGAFAIWRQASRAWTLTLAAIGVLAGTAAAVYRGADFSLERFILAAVGAASLQAAANMINDYYDYVLGIDRFDDLSPEHFGPGMAIQQGFVTPNQLWWGGAIATVIGASLGLVLVYQCGWVVLAIGILSVAAAYFYTAPPVSLAYHGLGDLAVFLFMGPGFVLGGYYVQAGGFSWSAIAVCIAMGLLASAVLQVNNMRDIENDRAHGKRTFSVIVGRQATIAELVASDALAYGVIVLGAFTGALPLLALAVLVTLPRAIGQIRLVSTATDWRNMNGALNLTGRLHLEFGVLLAAAMLIGRVFRL